MTIKTSIPVLAAIIALGGGTVAVAGDTAAKNTASTYGGGSVQAGANGVSAGGETSGMASARGAQQRERNHDRRDRRDRTASSTAAPSNSASTYGSGGVYTTRNSAAAGVTSGGSASGTGTQSTSTTVDAYGETNRTGSNADIYGNSTATSGATRTR